MHEHLSFVIHRTTRIKVLIAFGWLKGRSGPLVQWIRRLHIVMSVAKSGGLAGRMEPIAINQRMAVSLNHLHVLQADATHLRGEKICGAFDVALMLRKSADAGNAKEVFQLGKKSRLILPRVFNSRGRHLGEPLFGADCSVETIKYSSGDI